MTTRAPNMPALCHKSPALGDLQSIVINPAVKRCSQADWWSRHLCMPPADGGGVLVGNIAGIAALGASP